MTNLQRMGVGLLFCACFLAPLLAHGQKVTGQQHYEQGKAYFQAGAFKEAIVEFEQAYALTKKSGALFNIARAYEELGDKVKAIENYRRYLKAPGASRITEARARATALEKEVAEAEQAAAAVAARERDAAAHVSAARALVGEGKHAEAVERYRQAFAITQDAERVFDIAEAWRAAGDRELALGEYERYRKLAPTGRWFASAGKHMRDLEREIAASNRPPDPERSDLTTTPDTAPVEVEAKPSDKGMQWGWVALGAAVIAGGVAADLAPDSASNGELDAMDLVPLGLYGLGGVFVYAGVF